VCCAVLCCAERGVDTSGVQRTEAPTRDVYVERSLEGDRNFAGFGRATDSYCDCYLDPKQLPVDAIKVGREQRHLLSEKWHSFLEVSGSTQLLSEVAQPLVCMCTSARNASVAHGLHPSHTRLPGCG
jgi:hypothetical protein